MMIPFVPDLSAAIIVAQFLDEKFDSDLKPANIISIEKLRSSVRMLSPIQRTLRPLN